MLILATFMLAALPVAPLGDDRATLSSSFVVLHVASLGRTTVRNAESLDTQSKAFLFEVIHLPFTWHE